MTEETTSEPSQEIVKKRRGGDHGGRRPRLGEPRTVKLADPLWKFCTAQPGGAAAFLRRLIEEAMAARTEGSA